MAEKLTHEEYIARGGFNPTIKVTGHYIGMTKEIEFQCNICGETGYKKAQDLQDGRGCMFCAKTQTSYFECFIVNSLKKTGINVIHRDKKIIGSEIDIYLPDYKFAIEPGSWNFHKKSFERDLTKHEKCRSKGIDLLIIYDSFDPNYVDLVKDYDFIKTYTEYLTYDSDKLKQIVFDILKKINVDYNFTDDDWAEINDNAIKASRRETEEEFRAKLAKKRPDIGLIKLGKNRSDLAEFKCKKCGNTWKTKAVNIMRKDRNTGCPRCGGTQLKTHEEFIKQYYTKFNELEFLEKYEKTDKKIKYKCKTCGYEGRQTPSHLLEGIGCKACSLRKKQIAMTKTHEVFVEQIAKINPDIEIIGRYKNDRSKIDCKCKVCGNLIHPIAGDLLRGHGCNKCAHKYNAEKKQKRVKCVETGKIYKSLKIAQQETKIDYNCITNVCKGKQKTAGGYTWVFVDKD